MRKTKAKRAAATNAHSLVKEVRLLKLKLTRLTAENARLIEKVKRTDAELEKTLGLRSSGRGISKPEHYRASR